MALFLYAIITFCYTSMRHHMLPLLIMPTPISLTTTSITPTGSSHNVYFTLRNASTANGTFLYVNIFLSLTTLPRHFPSLGFSTICLLLRPIPENSPQI